MLEEDADIDWTARRTNPSSLDELNITTRLSTICLRKVLVYFGQIARKDSDNLEKLVITGKIEGDKPRRRIPMRWTDQIRSALDVTLHGALHSATDRKRWRQIVKEKLFHRSGHDPQ